MKKALFILTFVAVIGAASGQTNINYRWQSGYYKPSTGTYVQPYYKTAINKTNWDNYSTIGNIDPWTGASGSRARDYSAGAYNYGSGRTIYTGPGGGQYYFNSHGNKTYVPKRYGVINDYSSYQSYGYPSFYNISSASVDYSENSYNSYQPYKNSTTIYPTLQSDDDTADDYLDNGGSDSDDDN